MAKKKKKPSATEKALAKDYGYTLAFLKADPGLYGIFNKAVKQNYTPEKFQAEVKNSSWYKKHGETYRTNLALKTTDPGTYNERYSGQVAAVRDKSAEMGAFMTEAQVREVARHSMDLGYNESQLGDILSGYIKINNVRGQANSNLAEMKQAAWRNGMKYSSSTYQKWLRGVASGYHTLEDFHLAVKKQAKSLAPGFADQLDGGMDLMDIAQPYVQSMASTLEVNPQDIDLFDPTIRKAMSGTTQDGKPATTSLWQFEQNLRQDKRWLKTQNAQDSMMQTAHKVLSDFGFSGS